MKYMLVLVFLTLLLLAFSGCVVETPKINEIGGISISTPEQETEVENGTDEEVGEPETETVEETEEVGEAEEEEIDLCGNGEIDEGENCSNCSEDVKCGEKKICIKEECVGAVSVVSMGETKKKVDVKIGTVNQSLAAGDLVIVEGRIGTRHAGNLYRIKLASVVYDGNFYSADFELENAAGEKITEHFAAGVDEIVTFYDTESNEYAFNTEIRVIAFRES